MSDLRLALEIADPRPRPVFRPGERLPVTIRLESARPWEVRYVEVALFWRTSGKGTRSDGIAGLWRPARQGERLDVGVLEQTHVFVVPPLPPTYRGVLLKIDWWVGFYVRPKGAAATELEVPVLVGEGDEVARLADAIDDDHLFDAAEEEEEGGEEGEGEAAPGGAPRGR